MTTELQGPVVIGANQPVHVGSLMELNRIEEQSTYTAISWSAGHPWRCGGVFFIRSRGSQVGEWIETEENDQLGEMEYFGTDAQNTISEIAATCRVFQDGPAGPSRVPTRWEWGTGTAFEDVKRRFWINSKGSVGVGDRETLLPQNATGGFLYIPAMTGRPTGVPDYVEGTAAMCMNVTQNELCIRISGQWLFFKPVP